MSINAVSSGSSGAVGMSSQKSDPEYEQIKKKLKAYGVEPTGDKNIDKAKLRKIEAAVDKMKELKAQKSEDPEHKKKAEAAAAMAGASNLGNLNKILLGL